MIGKLGEMPLASLRCRSARFDDERLNKVKIATLKIRVRLNPIYNVLTT